MIDALQPAGAIYFSMDEADVERILAYPETMIGSDGLPHDEFPHPRLWGAFPRVLGHYARQRHLFTLEEAVHRMTGLPADRFRLAGRGRIAPGLAADLVVFDPARDRRRGHLCPAEDAGRRHPLRVRERGAGVAREPRHRRARRPRAPSHALNCLIYLTR